MPPKSSKTPKKSKPDAESSDALINPNPFTIKVLLDAIDFTTRIFRMQVLDYLKQHFPEDVAEKHEKNVYQKTHAILAQRYASDASLIPFIPIRSDLYSEMKLNCLDFLNWLIIFSNVVLAQSLGDTLGYRNSLWEFNEGNLKAEPEYINELIYQFIDLGGINDIDIRGWKASDDTIMYFETFRASMFQVFTEEKDMMDFMILLRERYLALIPYMVDRDPGQTTMNSLEILKNLKWNELPYNTRSIGAGSAMRSGCLGLFYPGKYDVEQLVKYAVESSRLTHNSATAILGSLTSAVFTVYAMGRIPVVQWPNLLMDLIHDAWFLEYIQSSRPADYEAFMRDQTIFVSHWKKYITLRFAGIVPRNEKRMRNPVLRYKYLTDNFSRSCHIPGGCADDGTILAYDAVLQSGGVFEKLIVYSVLHPGDSDTVGSMAFSWFAAYYDSSHFRQISNRLFQQLEFYGGIVDFINNPESLKNCIYLYYSKYALSIAQKLVDELVSAKK